MCHPVNTVVFQATCGNQAISLTTRSQHFSRSLPADVVSRKFCVLVVIKSVIAIYREGSFRALCLLISGSD
jgi:hypothetical protein